MAPRVDKGRGDAAKHVQRRPIIATVIPCFRVRQQIVRVVEAAAQHSDLVFVIDDCCPEGTAELLEQSPMPANVSVLRSDRNRGVGGAVLIGYRAALAAGCDIAVKVDGDGQMDPALIPYLTAPITAGVADYAKGNRFFNVQDVSNMPGSRLVGNAVLSFMTKLATGYWTIFDPTNGYTAIHARVLERLPFDRLNERYFFESDMLFRLGTLRARVIDVPMMARYERENSSMRPFRMILPFLFRNIANTWKRIFYNYFLRDFSVASVSLFLAGLLGVGGLALGIGFWHRSFVSGVPATSGEVMLAGLPLIFAMQLLLSFLSYDVEFTPRTAIHPLLQPMANPPAEPRKRPR